MTDVTVSRAAQRDLEDIWLRIASDNPRAATKILLNIATKIELLATHPRLAPRRPDILPRVRMLVARPYAILYRTNPNTDRGVVRSVRIVRIVDGRRDLRALFR
jgi:toxin ParE1/3/4